MIRHRARGRATLVVGAIATILLTSTLVSSPTQAVTRSISGTITAADGSGPIEGIQICASRLDPKTGKRLSNTCKTTGADGRYWISPWAGTYTVTARDYQYRELLAKTSKKFTLGAGSQVSLNLTMARAGHITGRISAPGGGTPPPNHWFWVEAYPVTSTGEVPRLSSGLSNTSASGYFDIGGLSPGRYRIEATDHGSSGAPYGRQWYPDSGTAPQAAIITVGDGEYETGHDLALHSGSTLTIGLYTPKQKPHPGDIDLFDTTGRFLDHDYTQDWHRTGSSLVTFTGLHSGSYAFKARASGVTGPDGTGAWYEWYWNAGYFAAARPVPVGEGVTVRPTMWFHYPSS